MAVVPHRSRFVAVARRRHSGFTPRLRFLLAAACTAALAACSGPDNGSGNAAPGTATTTFLLYAQANGTPTVSQMALSAAERGEVAARSRQWAAETLITRDALFPANAVALPPLYFGRVLAVGAAASGTTLAELLGVVPAPSSPAVAAGLVHGLYRQIRSGEATVVTPQFMDAVSAKGFSDTWSSLTYSPLSAGDLAAVPNLRLEVLDSYDVRLPWPQVAAFDGVFEREDGNRGVAPMLRVTGNIRSVGDATMSAVALELPQERHLVRITPAGVLSAWTADTLVQAIATVSNAITGAAAVASASGDLVLPVLSGFGARGAGDRRGMGEAMDIVHANLRGMDGKGGNYAELTDGTASLSLNASGMNVGGFMASRFIFSPLNVNGPGTFGLVISQDMGNVIVAVPCGSTDLRPSYLVLINGDGGVEMLARFARADGSTICVP
jgi:hypothetical protein